MCRERHWTSDVAALRLRVTVTLRRARSHRDCSSVDHWCSHTDTYFTTDKLVHRSSEPLLCVTTIQQNRGYWFRGTGFEIFISYKRNTVCNHQILSDTQSCSWYFLYLIFILPAETICSNAVCCSWLINVACIKWSLPRTVCPILNFTVSHQLSTRRNGSWATRS